MCDNLPSNFDISDILMVVYNLILSIRSTLFNYKQFVLHLNIGKFLKDSNSIKCCCNKYDHSFIIITVMLYQGTSILLIIRDFVDSYPKIESIANQKKLFWESSSWNAKWYLSIHWKNIKWKSHPREPSFRIGKPCYVISKWKKSYSQN